MTGNRIAAALKITGVILLALVMLVYLPITVPRFLGFRMYAVVSGSMEPAIAQGSLVYVKEADASTVEPGEIIAFFSAVEQDVVVTHRVVENLTDEGKFITKGDANAEEDMMPVGYGQLIGTVNAFVPGLGAVSIFLSSAMGKLTAIAGIALCLILEGIGCLMQRSGGGSRLRRK